FEGEGPRGTGGRVECRDHQSDSERADRLANARRRRGRQRRLGDIQARARRLQHRRARATAVQPARRQTRLRRGVVVRPGTVADDSRRSLPIQEPDGDGHSELVNWQVGNMVIALTYQFTKSPIHQLTKSPTHQVTNLEGPPCGNMPWL